MVYLIVEPCMLTPQDYSLSVRSYIKVKTALAHSVIRSPDLELSLAKSMPENLVIYSFSLYSGLLQLTGIPKEEISKFRFLILGLCF